MAGGRRPRVDRPVHRAPDAGRRLHRTNRKEDSRMNAWINKTVISIKLALRDRQTLFFSYLLPLFFLFLFGSIFGRGHPQTVAKLMPGLMCISAMSAGLFGLSIGLVSARE